MRKASPIAAAALVVAGAGWLSWGAWGGQDAADGGQASAVDPQALPTAGNARAAPRNLGLDRAPEAAAEDQALFVAPLAPSAEEARKVAELAGAMKAANPPADFTEPVAKGHDPATMRKLSTAFSDWVVSEDNTNAQVRYDGIDCSAPPCVMALVFNADRGGDFLGRTQAWMKENSPAGAVHLYPHQLDTDHVRLWSYFNPHAEGTREHHVYEQQAIVRIHEEVAGLPGFNPSRDSGQP